MHMSHIFRYISKANKLWCGSIFYALWLDFLHYDQNLNLSDAVFCQEFKNVDCNCWKLHLKVKKWKNPAKTGKNLAKTRQSNRKTLGALPTIIIIVRNNITIGTLCDEKLPIYASWPLFFTRSKTIPNFWAKNFLKGFLYVFNIVGIYW